MGDKAKGCKLTLPYPPTTNNLYVTVMIRGKPMRVPSAEAKRFKVAVKAEANRVGVEKLEGPVMLTFLAYRPRKRGDLSNTFKAIEDALTGIAYEDDEQVEKIMAQRFDDKLNPRMVVYVDPFVIQ